MSKSAWDLEKKLELDSLVSHGTFSAEQAASLGKQIDAIIAILTNLEEGNERAAQSGKYSAQGLSDLVEERRQKALQELLVLETQNVGTLDKRIASEAPILSGGLALSTIEAADVLIAQEIRTHLRTLDIVDVEQQYLEATRDGSDPQLEAAVETAPRILNLVRPETIVDGRRLRIERLNPTEAAKLNVLQEWRGVLVSYINRGRKAIAAHRAHGVL